MGTPIFAQPAKIANLMVAWHGFGFLNKVSCFVVCSMVVTIYSLGVFPSTV